MPRKQKRKSALAPKKLKKPAMIALATMIGHTSIAQHVFDGDVITPGNGVGSNRGGSAANNGGPSNPGTKPSTVTVTPQLTAPQKIEERVKKRLQNLTPAEKIIRNTKGMAVVEQMIRDEETIMVNNEEKQERINRENAEKERQKKEAEFKKRQEESHSERSVGGRN